MPIENRNIVPEKKNWSIALGGKLLILTATGVLAWEGLMYFTKPAHYTRKEQEPQKVERFERSEPNDFNIPYDLK
ncbi:MAG: hypothetical protein PHH54_06470 [Candidatus Nanoarchaeia archaeon]|nr:hypothetical protein [Candidatus Nanoarchaeia archaeon]MDD5741600.1 hypothetical protein [Candidatus Nanoarchaeia archaeon]